MITKKEVLLLAVLIILIALLIFIVADSQFFIPVGGDQQFSVGSGSSGTDTQFSFSPPQTTPAIPAQPTPGGGISPGAGGATGGISLPPIKINPGALNVNLALGEKIEREISVTNLGNIALNLSISQQNLTQLVVLRNTSIYLNPNETKNFLVAFIDNNQTGIFTGKIIVGGKEIPVSLNIATKKLLFDIGINILNLDSKVSRFGKLLTETTIIPKGDKARIDVQLNYIIKDFNDNIYMNKTEMLLVESQQTIKRDFNIGSLGIGNYTLGVQLIYPGGIASASSRFEITPSVIFGEMLYNSFLILIISSIIIIILIILESARKRDYTNS